MLTIETTNLQLIALDLESLILLRQDRILLEKHLEIEFSDHQISTEIKNEIKVELYNKLKDVRSNPENYEWFTNWEIILKSEKQSIGSIGFKGYPDETGTSVIDFYVDERYRNRGFATEALESMVSWAFSSENIKQIVAESLVKNEPSNRLLAKCGFELKNSLNNINNWELKRESNSNRRKE